MASMRTYLGSVAGFIVTVVGAAATFLALVEAYGVTLGGRKPGAPGYFGAPVPPLWDALLDLGVGIIIAAAGLWLRALARRRAATADGKSP